MNDKNVHNDDTDYKFLFHATFNQAGVGMAHVDLSGNIIRFNDALCEMLGYERDEFSTMTLEDVTHPGDYEKESDLVQKLLDEKKQSYSLRKRYINKDLSITWGHVTVDLIKDDSGEPQFLLGVVREIDAQVEAERESQKFSTIVEVQREVALSELNLNDTMQKVTEAALKVTEADGAVVEFPEDDEMLYRSVAGQMEDSIGLKLPINESISGLTYRDKEMKICHDVQTDDRIEKKDMAKDVGFRSGVLVPLTYKSKTFGVLKVISEQPYYFGQEDESTLKLLSGLLSSQIYHAIQFEDTKIQAKTDELTEVSNRRKLMEDLNEELDRSDRYDHELSLMFIDLDHFKLVNDSHGHATGDRVLEQLGKILQDETRSTDIIGRYGGEEFIVATPEVDLDGAREVAERIKNRLFESEFKTPDDDTITVTCSIGLTPYRKGLTVKEFIDRADQALYEAKKNGRNRIEVYRENPD